MMPPNGRDSRLPHHHLSNEYIVFMNDSRIVPRRPLTRAGLLLALFVLIAAAINVPWALTFMRSRTTIRSVPIAPLEGSDMPREWPSSTPHDQPWPAPEHWTEGGVFGCRVFDVGAAPSAPGRNGFSMHVQRLGWPCPVIEQKQMWWDWNDPLLSGPEPDPAPSLMPRGLILNPLLLGGGAWAVFVLPWLAARVATRWSRYRRGRCMRCGYPVGESPVCTECGSAVARTTFTPPTPSSTA